MNLIHQQKLSQLLDELIKLDGEVDSKEMFLKTSYEDQMLEIHGNEEGLLAFAIQVLKLAKGRVAGSHFNYDGASMLDSCEMPFEVVYSSLEN